MAVQLKRDALFCQKQISNLCTHSNGIFFPGKIECSKKFEKKINIWEGVLKAPF